MTKLYLARWVLPISEGPIEEGGVAVEGTRIVGVGARSALLERFRGAEVEEFGEAVITPGFVNCHTHLELTALRGLLEGVEGDFFAWLRKVTVSRNLLMTQDDHYVSAAWGAVEAARAGVTCVGDATDAGATTMRALRDAGLRAVVYREAFGPDEREAHAKFGQAREKVEQLRGLETRLVRLGLSPHAPYSVSAPLLRLLAGYAIEEGLPVMVHAAESRAEEQFLLEGSGPFMEGFGARGPEFRAPGVSTIRHLAETGVLDARPLLAHCIRVDEADIELIRERGASVAHCPKSNAKLGHGRAPFAAFLRAGLAVGLGSDSVASNNTCDPLEEARFATLLSRAAGDTLEGGRAVSHEEALCAATLGGARALGLSQMTGTLAEGLEADLVALRLSAPHQRPTYDPASALVFASSGRDVLLTVVAGREIFRDGRMTTLDEDELRARMADAARRVAG